MYCIHAKNKNLSTTEQQTETAVLGDWRSGPLRLVAVALPACLAWLSRNKAGRPAPLSRPPLPVRRARPHVCLPGLVKRVLVHLTKPDLSRVANGAQAPRHIRISEFGCKIPGSGQGRATRECVFPAFHHHLNLRQERGACACLSIC